MNGDLILLIGVGGSLTGNLIGLLPLVAAGLWATFHGRAMRRRKTKSSITWMSVFVFLIEIGRLWGTFKFRTFLLEKQ
jgi:hypothetical protein